MGRVSLTEDYDDRSVIAKLNEMDKRVKENTTVVTSAEASAKASAQAAQETADRFAGSVGAVVQNANAQINASKAQVDQAKAEVDETVTTVAQAVQTANNASASAQQSATTVEGYDTRLTAVEDADTHNVKLEGNQSITGIKTVPTETTGTLSQQIANSAKVGAELDNYAPMLRTTGNQTRTGSLVFRQTSGTPALSVNHAGVNIESQVTSPQNVTLFTMCDTNGVVLASFVLQRRADNGATLYVNIRNAGGTYKFVNIASGNS